jgi:predicted GH43/DUF377 family glycosyl hydrolase
MLQKSEKIDPPLLDSFGGYTRGFSRYVKDSEPEWSSTNPSIGFSEKYGYGMMVRSANYFLNNDFYGINVTTGSTIKNRLWYVLLDSDLSAISLSEVRVVTPDWLPISRGVEDARLFSRDGEWFFTCVVLETHTPVARLALFSFDSVTCVATFVDKYESWDPAKLEKNWMVPALESNDHFDFIYGPTGTVKDKKFNIKECTNPDIANIRGGSCLWPLGDETYLAVVHEVDIQPIERFNPRTFANELVGLRQYSHRFARYSKYGEMIQLSDRFIFNHYKVEFACGLVEKDDNFIISYGLQDITACIATINRKNALAMLKDI